MPQGLATQVLGAFKTGMDRSTRRGGKDGAKRLWTLQNAYLNERGDAVPRPGLQHVANVANSTGLYGWKGQLHVFHADDTYVDPANPLVTDHRVRYPLTNAPDGVSLETVHFAGVILGEIYLAAAFSDGTLRHYWLQAPAAWQPDHVYGLGELVQPSVPNGYYYQAPPSVAVPAWQAGTVYAVGDVVQPTMPNGWIYTVVEVTGEAPTSGADEPTWPTSDGAQVFEGTEQASVPASGNLPTGGSDPINTTIRDRYNLPAVRTAAVAKE